MDITKSIDYIKTHPWHSKVFNKLKADDITEIEIFFRQDFTDKNHAMHSCNRMFMDRIKPKKYTIIMEICCTIILHYFDPQ